MSIQIGHTHHLGFSISQADLIAGTPFEVVAPVSGYVREIVSIIQKDIGTGGTLEVAVDGTNVVGAGITVADGAAKGSVQGAMSLPASHTRKVRAGERIQVIPTDFASAGAINGHITINTGS